LERQFPLLEGGAAAPIKHTERCLKFGAAGEVKHLLKERPPDLPRNAEAEVT
jgi:hypothetical protein